MDVRTTGIRNPVPDRRVQPWRIRLRVTFGLLALAFVVPACTNAGSSAGSKHSSAASKATQNSGVQTYGSVQELVSDLGRNGIQCSDVELEKAPSLAVQQGRCMVGSEELVIAIHSSVDERDNQAQQLSSLKAVINSTGAVLVGGNWLVNIDTAEMVQQVRRALGGKVIS